MEGNGANYKACTDLRIIRVNSLPPKGAAAQAFCVIVSKSVLHDISSVSIQKFLRSRHYF
jgi:hypothetical protein